LGTGPTEIRIYFIILNCLIIRFGIGWVEKILLYILIASIAVLCIVVYRTQKYIWKIDMEKYIWKIDMAEKKTREYERQGRPDSS